MNRYHDHFKGLILLGIRDVADTLGLSRDYIYQLIRENKLPCQRTSSGYVFEQESVLEFQRQRMEKAKTDPRIQL